LLFGVHTRPRPTGLARFLRGARLRRASQCPSNCNARRPALASQLAGNAHDGQALAVVARPLGEGTIGSIQTVGGARLDARPCTCRPARRCAAAGACGARLVAWQAVAALTAVPVRCLATPFPGTRLRVGRTAQPDTCRYRRPGLRTNRLHLLQGVVEHVTSLPDTQVASAGWQIRGRHFPPEQD
jgi:hypothetical protein